MTPTGNGAGRRALVTGASGGFGEVFARKLAARGYDLAITARRAERLEALARDLRAQHGTRVDVHPLDLARPGAAAVLAEAVLAQGGLDLLVNNAGFGRAGRFASIPLENHVEAVQVNVAVVVELTHRCLPSLRERHGGIVNLSSVSGFQPLGWHAVYGAAKGFVLLFTEALHEELRGEVRCVALCPGPSETEFYDKNMPGGRRQPLPRMNFLTPEQIVDAGLAGLDRGDVIVVPGIGNRLSAFFSTIAPRALVRRAAASIFRRVYDE